MSDNNKPVSQGQLDKKENNIITVEHESVDTYFITGTQELILLTAEASKQLDEHAREIMTCVDEHHKASENYSAALENYGKVYSQPEKSAELDNLENEVVAAEKILQEKKDALQSTLGDFEATGAGYKEVVELIPIATKKKPGSKRGVGSRYAFVKKGYIDKLGVGVRHKVKITGKDKASASESIFTRDSNKNIKGINTQKIKNQLKELDSDNTGIKYFSAEDIGKVDKTLTDWADSWNKSLARANETDVNANIDVSAGAQFLRFTSNSGASGEWDPYDGKLSFKVEHSSVLSIASGTVSAKFYMPDRIGWPLKYAAEDRVKPLDMGMLRVYFETSLIGFAGASAQVESQIQVTTIGTKQVVMGIREQELPRFRQRRVTGAQFHNAREGKNEDEGLTASAEIFGGAKATLKLAGGVQWLQPKALTEYQGKTGEKAKAAAEFVDFCSISESLVGMAGLGIGGTLRCDFVNGRFCFKIAASLCVGVGAKGCFEAAVDYDKLSDFGGWLIYQLYGLDYAFFEVVTEDAFKAFSQICVMMFTDFKEGLEKEFSALSSTMTSINTRYAAFIKSVYDGLSASQKRNELALNILANRDKLLTFTPESKGILLYFLTRHGVWDHGDPDNYGDSFLRDIYSTRKEAVISVLTSIQTENEWFKVFTHRSKDGRSLAIEDNPTHKSMVAKKQMNELREFLEVDKGRGDEMDVIYSRLRSRPAWGYPLCWNDSELYRLCSGANPFYPKLAKFSPVNLIS
ncbi:ATPase [Hafnia paralvei]|uniref:ATPase n=1 Tax=Hafnia paralvei TaxID=546367 RepID=UPI00163BEA88|nr:ATPase [Hafnia paralvei]